MAAEAIKIRAQAAKLYKETGDESIEGYKTMPLEDLRGHVERIQKGGSGTAKGKTASANGATPSKGKATPAASAPAKGKGKPAATATKGKTSASTSAPAKSTPQKTSPAKGKAATGTAKRPTAAAAKGKATSLKAAQKTAAAKGKTTAKSAGKTTAAKPASRGKAQPVNGRVDIDNKAVDWKADWNGGKNGKRADVMNGLRKFKGDKAKVFALLAPQARTYYKGRTKHEAERMLVWLIGRVAFDFVTATGQHQQGTRAEYGTATDNKNVRRRERREEARKAQEKAARAAKRAKTQGTPAKGKTPAKGPSKPRGATKAGQRTVGKGKGK
jgi:hypothetical protein